MIDYNIFGKVYGDKIYSYRVWTDAETLTAGDVVTIVNSNCEFEFDNVRGCFENNLLHCFTADLQIVDVDIDNYVVEKSNNGGCYAFAECEVLKVHDKSY